MPRKRSTRQPKRVESFRHDEAKRPNLPSAEHQSVMSEDEQTPLRVAVERRNPRPRPAARLARQEHRRGVRGSGAAALHPGEGPAQGAHRRAETGCGRQGAGRRPSVPVRRLQRPAVGRGSHRVLPARSELVEPDDPGRFTPGHGLPGPPRRPARQGPVHLHRSALRHQVQLELPVVNDEHRRQGRQAGPHHQGAGAGQGVPGYLAGRHSLVPELPAGSADGGARAADRERVRVRADRRRERAPGPGVDGRGVRGGELRATDCLREDGKHGVKPPWTHRRLRPLVLAGWHGEVPTALHGEEARCVLQPGRDGKRRTEETSRR